MLMRLAAGVVMAWFLGGATGWAQPPKPWWKDEREKAELRLGEDQAARVDAIFQEWWPKLRASYEELNRREGRLDQLIRGNDTSEADIIRHLDQVKQARGEVNKNRTLMLYRMYRVLSPDQRVKLEEIRKRHERSRGPSRGGPPRDGSRDPGRQ